MLVKLLEVGRIVVRYSWGAGRAGVAASCRTQVECVTAHRLRRAQQVFTLYSKLWDEKAFKALLARMRKHFFRRAKLFVMGGAVTAFSWDQERIHHSELTKRFDEIDVCHKLKNGIILKKSTLLAHQDPSNETNCWEPFIHKDELVLWKREAPGKNGSGLYCYKMYGKYFDVSAIDFLTAFLDTAERKSWDSHVVDLHIIDSEPETNSDVIYWETKWPKLFNNRDYIFKRRFGIFPRERLIVVCNESTSHPSYPVHPSKTRVTDYWSYMVIKPLSGNFNEPGIEFSLTYYDDPGTSLPTPISLWVSSTGMPDYLKKLRLEAIKVASERPPEERRMYTWEEEPPGDKGEGGEPHEETSNSSETPAANPEDLTSKMEETEESLLIKIFPWLASSKQDDSIIYQMLIT